MSAALRRVPAKPGRTLGLAIATVLTAISGTTALAAPGAGAGDRDVAVAPVQLGEGVRSRVAEAVQGKIGEGLARASSGAQQLASGPECDATCRLDLAAKNSADYLLETRIKKVGPDFQISMLALSIPGGETRASVDGTCEICGDAELGDRAADSAASLDARVRASGGEEGILVLAGTPNRAEVFVDGVRVGRTPFQGEFEPGEHQIEIRKPGHASQTRSWSSLAGVTDSLDYQLSKSAAGKGRGRRVAGPLGLVLMGVGTAALGGGAALLAIDGREHQRTCTDDLTDGDGDCPFVLKTKLGGIVALGAGAAAAGTGVGLFVWSKKDPGDSRERAQLRLQLSPTRVGAHLRF